MVNLENKTKESSVLLDSSVKLVLSRVDVLSYILKGFVDEFKCFSLEEIQNSLLPDIGIVIPDKDKGKVLRRDAIGLEDSSEECGKRTYDLKLRASIPNNNNKLGVYLNIEAQNDSKTKYSLERRGLYYLSRLISSQYRTEFFNSDFNSIKKVYSIWICYNTDNTKITSSSVERYDIKPDHLYGTNCITDKNNYDLMSLIMIRLGSEDCIDNTFIRFIKMILRDLPLSSGKDTKRIKDNLKKEYNVDTYNCEEVSDMCSLSESIYNVGEAKGEAKGVAKERKEAVIKGYNNGVTIDVLSSMFPKEEVIAILTEEGLINCNDKL